MKITNKRITGLRTDYEISDEDFENDCMPFDDDIDSWLEKNIDFLNEFVSFYIACGLKYNALWNGSFSGLISSAVDTCCQHYDSKDVNVDKVVEILLNKYNIKTIESKEDIQFEVLN